MMMIKVAVPHQFKLKVIPDFKALLFPDKKDVHYIGGSDILPAPLNTEEETAAINDLGSEDEEEAKKTLIEHNLRLVVYIAKKFDNTGVGVEDLISIGTIGLKMCIRDRYRLLYKISIELQYFSYFSSGNSPISKVIVSVVSE